MTATLATVPDENWRSRVDGNGVLSVVAYVAKPQKLKHGASNQQRSYDCHDNCKRLVRQDFHASVSSLALIWVS